MPPPLLYTGCPLDRAAHLREDAGWIAARLADDESRIVPVWRGRSLVTPGEAPAVAPLRGPPAAAFVAAAAGEVVFLGLGTGGEAWFGADLSRLDADALPPPPDGAGFVDLKRIGPRLREADGSLLAYVRAIVHWHQQHRFCGRCGRPTAIRQGGHVRACADPDCGAEVFPRTDPVVIMLVEDRRSSEPRCLLARQPAWPRGLVSTLAGFVEPGEALEEAVAREVREEVGLEVGAVHYCGSQPWPFPCSLMLGFRADVVNGHAIEFDQRELEDARWFDRAAVETLEDHGLKLPYAGTMARALVEAWLDDPRGRDTDVHVRRRR
jgi:NAD+ diphosphatase